MGMLASCRKSPFFMIIGCIGFVLNVISATILHEHDHDAQEAAGVPQSAHLELPVSYGTTVEQRGPLHDNHRHETLDRSRRGKEGGLILLESAPSGVKPQDIKHDIEKLDGVIAIHELHVWRLNQQKTLASAHITVSETQLKSFQALARSATECFHAYGIHGVTLQPELAPHMIAILNEGAEPGGSSVNLRERRFGDGTCLLRCDAEGCVSPSCCE